MGKKAMWLALCGLMTAALVLTSCQASPPATTGTEGQTIEGQVTQPTTTTPTTPTTPTTTTPEEPKEPEMVRDAFGNLKEKPQYGGTITVTLGHANATDYFDPVISAVGGWLYSINYEYLMEADWAKGPSGTGENPMTSYYVPDTFLRGHLAESWEVVDLQTVIFHIRPGVHYQNKDPMNGREFTADDVVYTVKRAKSDARNRWVVTEGSLKSVETGPYADRVPEWKAELESEGLKWEEWGGFYVKKIDKYTVKYRNIGDSVAHFRSFNGFPMMPREAVEKWGDLMDWRHQVSTGPWMVVDCVPDSSVTWKRNPSYWMRDPFFPDNQLPYADRLVGLIIPDAATYRAALRTHKIDLGGVEWDQKETFHETNPELNYRQGAPGGSFVIFMRTDIEPFSDIRVRQALMLGIDQIGILNEYYNGNAVMITWPIQPYLPEYTPYEELPTEPNPEIPGSTVSCKDLWGRDVERAKALLAEAGYPTGFKTTIGSYTQDLVIDLNSIVVEQLAEIGVEVEYTNYENAVHDSILYSRQFPGLHFTWWGNTEPMSAQGWAHGGSPTSIYAFSNVVDPKAEELFAEYYRTLDPDQRVAMVKKENLRGMELCWEIPLPIPASYIAWTPWLKGYSGEFGMGGGAERGQGNRYKYIWVDRDLKYQITGQRD